MRLDWIVAGLMCATTALAQQPEGRIAGQPRVADGDTFEFSIRLFGVDTPETQQVCADADGMCYRCGERALAFIEELFEVGPSGRARREVSCTFTGDITYGRAVASCAVDGTDAGEALIRAGWAFAYREYLRGSPLEQAYLDAEDAARKAGAGMWAGRFVRPSEWRNTGARVACSRD